MSNLQSLPGGRQRGVEPLATGAVCVNGGQANEMPGTWSASLEWLVERLAPRFRALGFVEVRYRIKSWRTLDARTLLLSFSMGGVRWMTGRSASRHRKAISAEMSLVWASARE